MKLTNINQIHWKKLAYNTGQQNEKGDISPFSTLLYCLSGETKKNVSFLPLIFEPPLAPYIIQRKIQKIQRKTPKVSILTF